MKRHCYLLAIVALMVGCKPIVKNPIELGQIVAGRTLQGARPPVAWHIETRVPAPARTDSVTLPAGSTAAYVTVSGTDIPSDQLLTENEQERIAKTLLSAVSTSAPSSSCSAKLVFEQVDYSFHEHQYWADVSMTVASRGTKVFEGRKRFRSADGMTTWERMNTTPQRGKRALAASILDHFIDSLNASAEYLSACASG